MNAFLSDHLAFTDENELSFEWCVLFRPETESPSNCPGDIVSHPRMCAQSLATFFGSPHKFSFISWIICAIYIPRVLLSRHTVPLSYYPYPLSTCPHALPIPPLSLLSLLCEVHAVHSVCAHLWTHIFFFRKFPPFTVDMFPLISLIRSTFHDRFLESHWILPTNFLVPLYWVLVLLCSCIRPFECHPNLVTLVLARFLFLDQSISIHFLIYFSNLFPNLLIFYFYLF